MRVKVKFFGPLRDVAGTGEEKVELRAGADTTVLVAALVNSHPRLADYTDDLKLAVNQTLAKTTVALKDGDEVALLPPVSGGAPERKRRRTSQGTRRAVRKARRAASEKPAVKARLQKEDFSIDSLIDDVCRPEAGGVVLFLGTVKSPHDGKRIIAIEHDAYAEMATASLQEIAAESKARFDLTAVSVVHRRGRMKVGENIVGIAASAPSRERAFQGAKYVIEEIKRRTPLWKKEFGGDGSWWIEGEKSVG